MKRNQDLKKEDVKIRQILVKLDEELYKKLCDSLNTKRVIRCLNTMQDEFASLIVGSIEANMRVIHLQVKEKKKTVILTRR